MNAMRPSSEMTGSSSAQLVTARSSLSIRSASVTICRATSSATRASCTRVSAAITDAGAVAGASNSLASFRRCAIARRKPSSSRR